MIRADKLFGNDGAFHVSETPRILIFRGGALGDFILTLPAIAALRRRFPGAYIELAGYEKNACLALATNLVDHLQSLDSARMALYFQGECALPPEEKKHIASFDLIVSYLHDPDGVLLKHLKDAGAENIVAVSPLVKTGHASEHFYNPIRSIVGDKFEHGNFKKVGPHSLVRPRISAGQGWPALPVQTVVPKTWSHFIKCDQGPDLPREQLPRSSGPDFQECLDVLLEWPHFLKEKARRRLCNKIGNKRAVIIHPGSGSPAKNWPAEKFAMLAKKIRNETEFEPIIIGGEADIKPIAVMRSLLPDYYFIHRYFRKVGQEPPALPNKQWRCGDAHALPVERLSRSVAPDYLSLTEVASILSVAGGFVGNDSGITHLAAALGVPVVALFGPTDPEIWAPRGKNVLVIKSRLPSNKSLSGIGVEDVFSARLRQSADQGSAKNTKKKDTKQEDCHSRGSGNPEPEEISGFPFSWE